MRPAGRTHSEVEVLCLPGKGMKWPSRAAPYSFSISAAGMYFGPVGFLLFTLRRLGAFAGMLFFPVQKGYPDRRSVHLAVKGKVLALVRNRA